MAFISIESINITKADYTKAGYILVNDKYHAELNEYNLEQLNNADVVKCNPKRSATGYLYLNPEAYYSDNNKVYDRTGEITGTYGKGIF